MPYIDTATTVPVSAEKEAIIKAKLGKALSNLNKSESWLMLRFEDKQRMWFRGGNEQPMAMVQVSLFGKASDNAYDKMTAAVTDIYAEELQIDPDCIYVKYEEVSHWGWNGNNF